MRGRIQDEDISFRTGTKNRRKNVKSRAFLMAWAGCSESEPMANPKHPAARLKLNRNGVKETTNITGKERETEKKRTATGRNRRSSIHRGAKLAHSFDNRLIVLETGVIRTTVTA
jgi:hypothetical protein